jgi:hypothetical protein
MARDHDYPFQPPTLESMARVTPLVRALCWCGHESIVPIPALLQRGARPTMTGPELCTRLRCEKCGALGARIVVQAPNHLNPDERLPASALASWARDLPTWR